MSSQPLYSPRGHRVVLASLAALTLGSADPALAWQDDGGQEREAAPAEPGAEDTNQVLITGNRVPDAAVDSYVRKLTVVSQFDPLTLYRAGEFCPAVLGLSDERNREIEARMRQVAAAAEMEPAEAPCRTSALVFVVDDKLRFLEAFRKAHPVYFNNPTEKHWKFPKENGPAIAWHLAQDIDPQGNVVRARADGVKIVESAYGGSRIRSMIRSVLAMAVVVIERDALIGLTPVQIADYALMRAVTDTRPGTLDDTADTILTVLDSEIGDAVNGSLTQWDFAYVKARYSGDPSLYGNRQGAIIRSRIKKELREDGQDRND